MFVGEFAVWSVYIYQRHQARKLKASIPPSAVNQMDASALVDDIDNDLAKNESHLVELTGWRALLFWIPTMCDLLATTVSYPACDY
jgi:hypothetical protein